MKKIESGFVVTGFVAKDAGIRQFINTGVARFSLAVSHQGKNSDETSRTPALMSVEAWREKENAGSSNQLTKGMLLAVEGHFRSREWSDKNGVKHSRIVVVTIKLYLAVEKEETPAEPEKKPGKGKK